MLKIMLLDKSKSTLNNYQDCVLKQQNTNQLLSNKKQNKPKSSSIKKFNFKTNLQKPCPKK